MTSEVIASDPSLSDSQFSPDAAGVDSAPLTGDPTMSALLNAVTRPAIDPRAALRLLLGIDALTCAAFTALAFGATTFLARLSGLPAALLQGAGIVLCFATVILALAAARHDPPSALVWLVTAINVSWVMASLVVLAMVPGLTTIGQILVAVQALIVAGTAVVETRALLARRRFQASAVAPGIAKPMSTRDWSSAAR